MTNVVTLGLIKFRNKETRFLGPDHTFGRLNTSEPFGAGDVLHDRCLNNTLKGKERERAFVASARSFLSSYNYTKFKTLVDAFKFYDKDKDSFISRDELKLACAQAKYAVADDLLDVLLNDCDQDGDGRLNFLEFVNFLCFKDSMKTGLPTDSSSKFPRIVFNSLDLLYFCEFISSGANRQRNFRQRGQVFTQRKRFSAEE